MATEAAAVWNHEGPPTGSKARRVEPVEVGFRKSAWQELKMAMKRARLAYRKKMEKYERADFGSTQDLDSSIHSHRSIVSESNQSPGNKSWDRTFDDLHLNIPSRTLASRPKISESPTCSFGALKTAIEVKKGRDFSQGSASSPENRRLSQSYQSTLGDDDDSSVFIKKLSTSALEGEDWHGKVTIGRELPEEEALPSPDHKTAKTLQRINFPIPSQRTRSKKRSKKLRSPKGSTSKQGRKSKALRSRSLSSTASIPWGDYAMAQHVSVIYSEITELKSPARNTSKKLKNKPRFDRLFHDYDGGNKAAGAWGRLLDSFVPDTVQRAKPIDFDQRLVDSISLSNLPKLPPTPDHVRGSFLGRFHAVYTGNADVAGCKIGNEVTCDVEVVEKSNPSENQEDNVNIAEKNALCRFICFADDQGLPMERIYQVGDENDPWAMRRIIVLLLDPTARKFEFMQGEYSCRAGATVADLLRQLPLFATEEKFMAMVFSALWSTSEHREFGLEERLYELELGKREVTLAVMDGASGKNLLDDASPVLKNDKIMRAVKKASRVGRGLKYISSCAEMEQERIDEVNSSSMIRKCGKFLTVDGKLAKKKELQPCAKQQSQRIKPYKTPIIQVYNANDDEIPDLSDESNAQFVSWRPILEVRDEQNPHEVMKYVHAALWATVGISFSSAYSS